MTNGRFLERALAGVLWTAALCVAGGAAAAQQTALPLDDKARYEKALEQKVDEVLLKLLGPNQAKVVVQATMDFSRTEKLDVTSGEGGEAGTAFKWQTASAEGGQPFNDFLLPGFPVMGSGGENKSYEKQFIFPSTFIKRLTVSVIINKDLPEEAAQNVRTVVSEVLGLDERRGDLLTVVKTPFAPVWRTIWYTPEAVSLLFKYGILSFIGIISMIVVAIGFLKLAGAMNTMAKAQQSHQITMDLGRMGAGAGAGGPAGPGGPALPGLGALEKPEAFAGKEADAGAAAGAEGGVELFNVRPEHVDFLVNLMSGEDPGNIALVAGHLPEAVKKDFLRKLPPDVSADVVANLAEMRYVDPDVVGTIREELERRLSGAFGGVGKAVAVLEQVSLKARKDMFDKLQTRHPELAAQVRGRIFLAEDLVNFSDKDMSIIATTIKMEEWSLALWALPAAMKEKLRGQFTEKAWAMLEQTMKYGAPSAEKAEEAVERVAGKVLELVASGRVVRPEAPKAEAPAPPPPPPPPPPVAALPLDEKGGKV